MAVKEGLPATDFSRMNREYIRNVAEGETVKDGLPATDFSRMNREYIKAVVEEAGGGGGGVTFETVEVTHVLPEGKTLHDFKYYAYIDGISGGVECISVDNLVFPFVSGMTIYIELENGNSTVGDYLRVADTSATGDIEADGISLTITGAGTVTITWVLG